MLRNSGRVTTIRDAREVIEEIARRKGTFTPAFRREAEEEAESGRRGMLQAIEGGEEIRKDLVKALRIISTDLYTNRARFLMEVIQNADDNTYADGETPTVFINVFPNHVKIECNENGFSQENILALCRTGRSSKRPGQGYTGEKGIGFKSVFKLAERAHIRSFPYYFQLDQTNELGIITPQWDEEFFLDHEVNHQTTIVLDRIYDQSTNFSSALESDIQAIDLVLILFLRRIQRIHLRLFRSSSDHEPTISKRFRRLDSTADSSVVSLKNEDTNTKRRFYKHQSQIQFSGSETRRPGITTTDIVLAFPVKKEQGMYVPRIVNHNFAFAYLPLGNFGFKFIIQADFLTTSNRQSVDEDNHWNRNIAGAIPHAFQEAIENFNLNRGQSNLRGLAKTWPLYLGEDTPAFSWYWRNIATSIREHLKEVPIIKNLSGGFEVPKNLMFLDWAHDSNGNPMFNQMRCYVSPDYPSSVRIALLSLGVTAPNWRWVCHNLQLLQARNLLHVKMQSSEWSSDLAKVILESHGPGGEGRYARDLGTIRLIPMANGTWRCPPSRKNPIYFPVSQGATIPPGLPLSLVDEETCTCPHRSRLFRLLGVKVCNVTNVVERIFNYHATLGSAENDDLIAQLKYLYNMRRHMQRSDMERIYFKCTSQFFQRGTSIYIDVSDGGELRRLFSGYSEAYFLDGGYFAGLNLSETTEFVEWLSETAKVALAPRFIATDYPYGLHRDFIWLLENRSNQVLTILHDNWSVYGRDISKPAERALGNHDFMCRLGVPRALKNTYIPLPTLLEKIAAFGDADDFGFLTLPSGEAEDWIFLSRLGARLDAGLRFYLWVFGQIGFDMHADVDRSKQLFLEIQSRAFSIGDENRIRRAFENASIVISGVQEESLQNCVWHGPNGLSSKATLYHVYGNGLTRLFQGILRVPNATSNEALEHLEQLQDNNSTTMAEVAEVYVFIQKHCANTFSIDDETAFIALPSSSGSLEWKTRAQCVWGDAEFSQNELVLESKIAIQRIVERNAPIVAAFFRDVLKLPNAGIDELLSDLALMQQQNRDNPRRVYRIYERIESCRRSYPNKIKNAFRASPLVFLRGINNQCGRWLPLTDCIWTRSILRNKYALMPSLDQYRDLFRDILGVPNANMNMLIAELRASSRNPLGNENRYEYVKELLREIGRLRKENDDLSLLDYYRCWPCRTPTSPRDYCSIGDFYVNDRQDLFHIFSSTHTFLDLDFDTSRSLAGLLRNRDCDQFLSEEVTVETEACAPLRYDHDLTQEFQSRADALVKYFEYAECESQYELRPLLENVDVWLSADIRTHYTLDETTVTKRQGGSSVIVSTRLGGLPNLKIYFSANQHTRDCALVEDFPAQLVEALELEPSELQHLRPILQVPLASLQAMLVRKGIIGEDAADDYEEILVVDSTDEDEQSQSSSSSDGDSENMRIIPASSFRSNSARPIFIESASVSARSEAANLTLRPYVRHQRSSRPTTLATPESPLHIHLNESSDESPHERPVTLRPTAPGLYSTENRNRNRERLQDFARNADPASSSQTGRPSGQPGGVSGSFDMGPLAEALGVPWPVPVPTPIQINPSPRRRAGAIPNRNGEEMARDFEVGFLGEQFVYTLLHDTLQLPDFTGENNWTSSLRSRAGFPPFGREVSDFTYRDTQGALTRHFLQMRHPYPTPEWLSTACDNVNVPKYLLEVKSTTSQDPTTTFYMSSNQHRLARRLRVIAETPSEIYVVLRVSGLDALEDGARHRPRWRVYLDPYTLGDEGFLNFVAPTYAVTATA